MFFQVHLWSIIFLSCLVAGFIWCVVSGRSIIPVIVLGTIWNVYFRLGLTWNGMKILVLCSLVLMLFSHGSSLTTRKLPILHVLCLLILYVTAVTVFGALTVKDSALSYFQPSALQEPPLRGIIATGFWFFGPLCFLIGYKYTPSVSTVDKCIKVVLFSSAIAAIVGAVQFVAYYVFPPLERLLAFFCIQASEDAITTVTASNAWAWYRPTPFCSEPRHFAFAMALAAAMVILSRRCRFKCVPPVLTHQAWIFIYVGLCFAAASTSSLAGLFISLPGLLAWLYLHRRRDAVRTNDGLRIVAILAVSAVLLFAVESRVHAVSQRFEHYMDMFGLFDRPSEWFESTDNKDTAAAYLAWLFDSPAALLCGAGPGNGPFYAYEYFSYDTGRSRTTMLLNPRLPIIESLASVGILGTLFLAAFWWGCWKMPLVPRGTCSVGLMDRVFFLRGILVFLMLYLFSNDCTSLVWLMLGMLVRVTTDAQKPTHVESMSYPMVPAGLPA